MVWPTELVQRLLRQPVCGYRAEKTPATEPTALTSLALHAFDHPEAALQGAMKLAQWQSPDGSVGVRPLEPTPIWPTSLAMLAWMQMNQAEKFQPHLNAAAAITLREQGKKLDKQDYSQIGHNGQLVGWSWAANTHSWIEPTILHLLSLQALGKGNHPRVREAIALLIDRQLPGGGCNYGNTSVLGQMLRPHLQPSGMLLLAIVGEEDPSGRVSKSVEYVAQAVNAQSSTASLCWGLIGLAAAKRRPADADAWLAQAYKRTVDGDQAPQKFALLAQAALGEQSPLITLPQRGKKTSS